MITRRGFLTSLLAVPLAATLPTPKFAWDKTRIDYIPTSLMGIPYHQSNASMGTWLGFERSTVPQFSSKYTAWLHPAQREAYFDLIKLTEALDASK